MVDNKLSTGSIRKKHLAEAKKEKTEKIVGKVKQEANDAGSPAKKQRKPKSPKGDPADKKEEEITGNSEEDKKAKKKLRKKKNQKTKVERVVNMRRTAEREALLEIESKQYLEKWHADRENWKFNKNLQTWLIVNMFDSEKVSGDVFGLLCPYLDSGKGIVRDNVTKVALKKSRNVKTKVDPDDDADDDQEVLARANRLVKLMTSQTKKTDTSAASPTKRAAANKKDKGARDQLGLKESKTPVKKEVQVSEVKSDKKKVGKKSVGFTEEDETPSPKKTKGAAVNGTPLGSAKKGKKAK